MSKYKGMIDRHVKVAALATGPRTNSYAVQDYMKARWPRETPEPSVIGQLLNNGGYARPTGRRVVVDGLRSRTAAEFEILEAGAQ